MAKPLKILMLDDNVTDAEIVQQLLKKGNPHFEFRLAMNKNAFLLALDQFQPDVILSDNSLPQFNATEALKIARQQLPNIPFILVTGTISDEFAANIIKSGADDYILKDRLVRLPVAIAATLKRRTANKELVFQNEEKEKRAAELIIANKELVFQNEEKEKRAAELVIANKELAFQNDEKEKRAAELIVANKELNKTNEALQNSLKEVSDYKCALDASSIVSVTDTKGIIKYVNENFCKISKYSSKELIGQDHRIFNSGYHPKSYIKNLWATITNGKIWRGEFKNKAKDGSIYWVDVIIVPFLNKQNKPHQYLAKQRDITERKKTEKALAESENHLRTIIEAEPECVKLLDKAGLVLDMNSAGLAMIEADNLQQIKEKSVLGLIEKSYKNSFNKLIQNVFKGESGKLEFEITGLKGTHRWMETHAVPLKNAEGKIISLLGVSRDITEHKKTEEALLKERNLSDSIINGLPNLFFLFDETGKFLRWNKNLETVSGYSAAEIGQLHPIDFFDDDEKQKLVDKITEGFIKGKAEVEAHLFTKAKEKILCNFIGWRIMYEGKPCMIGTGFDITDRKLAEEERLRLSSILEATSDFVGIAAVDQSIVFLNTAGRKALGYGEMEDLSQKKILDFSPVWANEIILKEGIPAAIQTGKWIGETAFLTRSGVEIPVSQVIIAHKNSSGEPQYLSTIARDISTQKEMKRMLEQQNKVLAISNMELEQFAYVASHDLQEPLRMVSSFLDLLEKRMKGQLDETTQQYIYFAVDGAERMKSMIQALLEFSRVGTNKEVYSDVDLNEVMQYATRVLEEDIKKNQAVITINPMPVITANKILITQLFVNLVCNALKFHGNEKPRIEVGFTEDAGQWIFYVKDNGIGIEPKNFERIFIIFQRLHIRNEYPGTGIGLAICKKIVDNHKGKIWVESEPGKSSTFYFSLPTGQAGIPKQNI